MRLYTRLYARLVIVQAASGVTPGSIEKESLSPTAMTMCVSQAPRRPAQVAFGLSSIKKGVLLKLQPKRGTTNPSASAPKNRPNKNTTLGFLSLTTLRGSSSVVPLFILKRRIGACQPGHSRAQGIPCRSECLLTF